MLILKAIVLLPREHSRPLERNPPPPLWQRLTEARRALCPNSSHVLAVILCIPASQPEDLVLKQLNGGCRNEYITTSRISIEWLAGRLPFSNKLIKKHMHIYPHL